MPMWAKLYLQEIQRLEELLNQRLEELSSLKAMHGLRGCNLSEKVQTSTKGDNLESAVIKCAELQDKVNAMIDEFVDKKNKIISQIQSLTDTRCIKILYMRYMRYMSFESIAVELCYSYDHIRRLHAKALKDFERCHKMPQHV